MRKVSFIRAVFLIVALIGFVPVVHAVPITYVQTGIGSGILGSSPFNNAFITVTLTGDTTNVVPELFDFNCSFCFVNVGTTTVEIPGVGTAIVTDPTGVWAFAQPVDLDDDPTTPDVPGVVIGTLDDPPLTDSFTALGGTAGMALLGYDLTTPIGPLSSGIISGVGYPEDLFVNTTLGHLRFRANITSDPDATFTATTSVTAVPEPATLLLFGSGAAAFFTRVRNRARR